MPLSGLIAAPHTPFHADGRVNFEGIGQLADHLVANDIDGVFVCGTTGEGLSLTRSEREAVAEAWVRTARRRVPIVVHVGCAAEAEACELARHAAGIGVDAIAAVAPFYHRPSGVSELIRSFRTIAAAAPHTPFYFYDIPSMTGVSLPTNVVIGRARDAIPTFAGVKFSNPDLVLLQECLAAAGSSLDVLFGVDEMLLASLPLGVTGAVGSTYNFSLPLYRRLMKAFETGDLKTARLLQQQSVSLVRVLERFGGLAAGKAVMSFLGIDCGPVRSPLRPLDRDEMVALRDQLDAIGFFSKDFSNRPSS